MSMISAQVDRLRELADELTFQGDFDTAQALRDAADTIWELRCKFGEDYWKLKEECDRLRADSTHWELAHCPGCRNVADLQEALDENAKLREELDQWHSLTDGIELPEYPITEFRPKDLERENAKLRNLAVELYWDLVAEMPESILEDRKKQLKELGIEVGE